MGFILTDESLLSRDLLIRPALLSPSPSQPLVSSNDPSRACNFHPEMTRVVQLDNDNKDNNDKNNCYSNEENHGAGSDLTYCKRLPLSLSTMWRLIMLLISEIPLFKYREIKFAQCLKKKINKACIKIEFFSNNLMRNIIFIIPALFTSISVGIKDIR